MHGKHINQPVLWGNDVNMIQFDGKAILWLYFYIFYLNGNETSDDVLCYYVNYF